MCECVYMQREGGGQGVSRKGSLRVTHTADTQPTDRLIDWNGPCALGSHDVEAPGGGFGQEGGRHR